jgi:hypothetical protein
MSAGACCSGVCELGVCGGPVCPSDGTECGGCLAGSCCAQLIQCEGSASCLEQLDCFFRCLEDGSGPAVCGFSCISINTPETVDLMRCADKSCRSTCF